MTTPLPFFGTESSIQHLAKWAKCGKLKRCTRWNSSLWMFFEHLEWFGFDRVFFRGSNVKSGLDFLFHKNSFAQEKYIQVRYRMVCGVCGPFLCATVGLWFRVARRWSGGDSLKVLGAILLGVPWTTQDWRVESVEIGELEKLGEILRRVMVRSVDNCLGVCCQRESVEKCCRDREEFRPDAVLWRVVTEKCWGDCRKVLFVVVNVL